ncbi:hypothetical protein [Colwellia psychrerythraea]|uniref:Uncharacterized protein n=1 Tax=Colwellia psychrerythraea TaxID=28229 RepID=A0A099KVM9_COLPS|nr:hypothetical protein [Colwellia psychrerythraea]KGJ94804.1 hypothetical protein GAB14E_2038 [Colwellia psychrerythraea]
MNIFECSKKLRELNKAHAHYTLSLDEYRRDRKILLDALDHSVNGIAIKQVAAVPQSMTTPGSDNGQHVENHESLDKTQPYFAGKIDKYMSFIKGSNNS